MTRSALLYGLAAAGANILGAVAVTSRTAWSVRALDAILSFAAGFLISVSLVDLFPEAIRVAGATAPAVALGAYVLVHLTQHTIGRHFHFGEETHKVSEIVSVSSFQKPYARCASPSWSQTSTALAIIAQFGALSRCRKLEMICSITP